MIIVIISFLLDGIVSSIINYHSLMYPLFSLLSLITSYTYFNQKDNSYIIMAFILGLSYDLVYTDTLFFNACLFLSSALLLKKIFEKFPYNYISVLVISFIMIFYYRILSYLILAFINYLNFSISFLLQGIYSSIIINIIYISVAYLIISSNQLIFHRK